LAETLAYLNVKRFLIELSERVIQGKSELNAMDAASGDGDFGSTMALAFGEAKKALEDSASNDVGSLLTLAGTGIMSSAGGASGPIFGAFFIEAGKIAKGKQEISVNDIASMFEKSLEKIRTLGGAHIGDKTMVDGLEPAATALREAANAEVTLVTALDRAAGASARGAESTKQRVAKYGRAKYLGEQTLGLVDPGAYLVSLVFGILAATASRT
jgi:dihydroxyacetone kinase phosphoprotein-dependent L subunit